ncbi:MAG: agmatinase [Oxalobacteraceae bacterium]|nr:MAG: agmatinase [Oxalobacteraceae bacterium]
MTEKPFQGLATFLKSPVNDLSRKIGVLGLPFDGATSYRPGARFGPNAVRTASMMLTDGGHPVFGVDPCQYVTDLGDVPVSNLHVAKSLDQIESAIHQSPFYRDPEKRLMFIGGDHTITTAALRAIAPEHENLFVLHLDAHCDTWADHFGDPIGHGTWVRNVIEEGLVSADSILQIGIRSPVDPVTRDWLPKLGGRVFSARRAPDPAVLASMIPRDRPIYISLDIDCLDPAYAPGTGTPEIGGLTPHFLLDLLESLKGRNIIGADVVEVNPSFDPTGITALAGATMLWTIAGLMI